MIVVGMILDQLAAVVRDRVVPHPRGFDLRHDYTHEPLQLRSVQSAYMPVTRGHDWGNIIGSVRHVEIGGNEGDAWASATCTASCPTMCRSTTRSSTAAATTTPS